VLKWLGKYKEYMEGTTTAALTTEAAHKSGIHVELAAAKLGEFFGIPITSTVLMAWVVLIILGILALTLGPRLRMIPSRLQTLLEWAVEGVYDYISDVLGSREMARKFFPLLMTIFLFFFVANVIEFTPGIGSLGIHKDGEFLPLLRSLNSDLNVPLVMAIISFLTIEITGILTLGAMMYARKFFVNPLRDPLGAAVGLLEVIGDLVRVVSLSFRLFGNILAGEVVIVVATYFAPYGGPLPFMMFELFIGTLQAAIFSLLTLFFIKLAITEPHGAESHAH
jgi:F-type H+-transporting ATPase subunit a